jgi:hypothetical protein
MAGGRQRGSRSAQNAPAGLKTDRQSDTVHTSLYLPRAVHDALRQAAFDERVKIHDVVMEGIEAALRQRGYPSIERLKAGKKR